MEPVVLFTTLGPNPAPLTELLWALARHHQRLVVEAHVVVASRGQHFLERELLVPGGPLDQLIALLGEELAHGSKLHIHPAQLPDGTPLDDDEDPAHAEAYQKVVWNAARTAQEAAGTRPLVFALAAGRRRTMVAMLSMAFQMLARPQDTCVDVRVDLREAEGGSGFFFPEQQRSLLFGERGTFDAREVEVQLVPVALPRLRGLLRHGDLATAQKALAAAQQAVDLAALPTLRVDLEQGICLLDGQPMKLATSHFLWYATLVIERWRGGDGWTLPDHQTLRALLTTRPVPAWLPVESLPEHFRRAHRREAADLGKNGALRTARVKAHHAVERIVQARSPRHAELLIPVMTEEVPHRYRVELPANCIQVHDPHRWVTLPAASVTLPGLFCRHFVVMVGWSSNTEQPP